MGWIDLHMHSINSDDGEFTPQQLMEQCQAAGVKTAAIADHNTTKGVAEGKQWAEKLGITYVTGVELDCCLGDINLHVLGYHIDPQDPAFEKIETELLAYEQEASKKRLAGVKALGIRVDEEKVRALARDGVVTGEIIAEVALADPANDQLLKEFKPGGKRSDNPFVNFYWDFCSQGKPAYAHIPFITLDQAVATITGAGGIAVLAHPGNNVRESVPVLEQIFAAGVTGMEVFSSYHSPGQTRFYLSYARKNGIMITCGSDYHGKTKPSVKLGGVDTGGLDQEIYDRLMNRPVQQQK